MRAALAIVLLAAIVPACTIGEDTHEEVTFAAALQAKSRTCSSGFTSPDLAGAKACGSGKGHCADGSKVLATGFPSEGCDGGQVCIPDKILTANGQKLKSCSFFIGGKPGVCMSTLQKDVSDHKNELQPDVCDADERCVPCVDPRDGSDTHVCDPTGVHSEPCTGGASQGAERLCCHGAGTCLRPDAVPDDQRSNMGHDTCGATNLCAPRSLVSGNPVKCDTLGVADGVCVDVCFASMLRSVQKVTRSSCGPTEVCVPCLIGKGQGMPGCD